MRTGLLICAEDRATISRAFVDALADSKAADRVASAEFEGLEAGIRAIGNVDDIVVFPCVVFLPDGVRERLLHQLNVLQKAFPNVRLHLANALGCDPRLVEMVADRQAVALKGLREAPILTVESASGTQVFGFDDMCRLSGQIPDVGQVVPGRLGQGVWAREVLPEGDLKVIFHADDDRFSASVDLAVVREKGLLIYGLNGQSLPVHYGGPVRLLIPGYGDRCANVKGVARVEVCR